MKRRGRTPVIAIDGPVASGKTTVGKRLAQRLGYRFLDTGLMYRAITWDALQQGMDLHDSPALARLARSRRLQVRLVAGDQGQVWVDGQEAAHQLLSPEVEEGVSLVASVPGVRRPLVAQQRLLAREGPVVMVGRDIGTVVLPAASLKVFLTASLPERARRRHAELQQLGQPAEHGRVLLDLERRDQLDSGRAASPLRPAKDSHILVTDGLSVEEVVDLILALWERR